MERNIKWHHGVPSQEQMEQAQMELTKSMDLVN
jgi:hypothetical protein